MERVGMSQSAQFGRAASGGELGARQRGAPLPDWSNSEGGNGEQLPPPPSSFYKTLFGPEKDGLFTCRLCNRSVASGQHSTGNLGKHIERHHPKQFAKVHADSDPTVKRGQLEDMAVDAETKRARGEGPSIRRYLLAPPDVRRVEARWMLWITKRGVAYDAIKDPLFELARKADNPAAKPLPCWQSMKQVTLAALYQKVIMLQHASLRSSESAAISFDGWTGKLEQGHLIGIHYHWIDRQWRYHSSLLDLVQVQGSATAEHLCDMVSERINNRLAKEQMISGTVGDNAPNIQAAGRMIANNETYGCAAHVAQLVFGDVCKDHFAQLLVRARALVAFFRQSNANDAALIRAQKGACQPLHLQKDGATRWNSSLDMLKRLQTLMVPIERVARRIEQQKEKDTEGRLADLLFDATQKRELEVAVTALQPLADLTDQLQRAHTSAAEIHHFVDLALQKARELSQHNNAAVACVAATLVRHLNNRFAHYSAFGENVPLTLRVGALHPAFGHFPALSVQQRDAVWAAVLHDAQQLIQHPQSRFAPSRDVLAATLRQLRSHFEEDLKGAPCPFPLRWWDECTQEQPTLAVLAPVARMYLALPAASADLERSFSSTGFILEGRERLLVRNLEAQAVIRDYLITLERTCVPDVFTQQVTQLVDSLGDLQNNEDENRVDEDAPEVQVLDT